MKEQEDIEWSWTPSKRRLQPSDVLFEEGDIFCSLIAKQLPIESKEDYVTKHSEFKCNITGCNKAFNTLSSYESHYHSVHKNTCSVCRKTFPSNHLLDIHLLESHDSMFEVLASKQDMFQCLSESCDAKFHTAKQRRSHVISVHHYPSNFRFDKHRQEKLKPCKMDDGGKGDHIEPERMEVLSEEADGCKNTASRRQFTYKIPSNICFGQGATKSFQNAGHSRKHKGKKKHWHQTSMDVDTVVDIEKVAMDDLAGALDDIPVT